MAETSSASPDGILARTMRILACFNDVTPELSAAALSEQTGIPLSTVHRIVAQLCDLRVLQRSTSGGYSVGMWLWELGELSPAALGLRERALPHLLRLYEITGGTIFLTMLDPPEPETANAVIIARVAGPASMSYRGRMGGRVPLHATSVGKALLAEQPDDWVERFLEQPLPRWTTSSITRPDELRAELSRIRERGYATSTAEITPGTTSIAVTLHAAGLPAPLALGLVLDLSHSIDQTVLRTLRTSAQSVARSLRA